MSTLVIFHGIIGTTSLVSCLVVMCLDKLKSIKLHKTIGYIFVVSTVITSLLGIYVALLKDIPVLVGIGIATILQLAFSIRAIHNKSYNVSFVDNLLTTLFIINLYFLLYIFSGISLAIFSIYFFVLLFHVYHTYIKKNKEKTLYLAQHISHMFGAVVSVITAVIIGALGSFSIYWIFWFLPSVVFIYIVRYFRLKYAPIRAIKIKDFKW